MDIFNATKIVCTWIKNIFPDSYKYMFSIKFIICVPSIPAAGMSDLLEIDTYKWGNCWTLCLRIHTFLMGYLAQPYTMSYFLIM